MAKRVRTIRFMLNGVNTECFGASFSHVMSEAAIITVSTRIPESQSLIAGDAELVIVYDDATTQIAGRGKISGFPMGMSGDEVTVEFICRNDDNYDEAIDNLYRDLNEMWQPEKEVISTGVERRAEGFIPFFIYVDPITHALSFKSINGQGTTHTLHGEGARVGESYVFRISPMMTSDPIKEMIVESVAEWQQVSARVIDFGEAAIGTLSSATPAEYEASVDNIQIEGGGSYAFTGSDVRPRFNSGTDYPVAVRKAYIDSRTSILHPVIYENIVVNQYLSPSVDILATITQDRRERCRIKFTMDHGTFGGRKVVEEYFLDTPEDRFKASTSYPAGSQPGFSRVDTFPDSVHYRETYPDDESSREVWIPRALINRAYSMIIDSSYCLVLKIDTTAEVAMAMSVGDRCRVNDRRFASGYAEGRVSMISYTIEEDALGVIEIQCSTCTADSYTFAPPESLDVQDAESARPFRTQQEANLFMRNPDFFLEDDVEHTNGRWDPYDAADQNGLVSQYEIVAEINTMNTTGITPVMNPAEGGVPEVYDVRNKLLEFMPPTQISIKLKDVGQVEELDENVIEMEPVVINVMKGLI